MLRPSRPRLLVTGFGPFPGVSSNPSTEVVRAVAAARPEVATALLSTEWSVTEEIARLARRHDTVVMFGVAARAFRIRYERLAFPVASPHPDAAGRCAEEAPPRSVRSALDVARLVADARASGFPVVVSGSAGTYICNAGYAAALAANPRTIFVHIPAVRPRGALGPAGLAAHALWLVDRLSAASATPRRAVVPRFHPDQARRA